MSFVPEITRRTVVWGKPATVPIPRESAVGVKPAADPVEIEWGTGRLGSREWSEAGAGWFRGWDAFAGSTDAGSGVDPGSGSGEGSGEGSSGFG